MDKNEQQMPRLGEPVPAFEAMTTQGKVSFPADYKGKWVILFSHPADFTPICTSEVLTFGARTAEFKALNCELIGLSVDSRNSHIAWLRTIREKIEYKGMKDIKVEFPIIDDVSMKVANLYGMIQPGESQTAAVRAVFFVDPKGVLRAMIYYPLALGRNFDEIKRVLVGLQAIDAFGVAMPADWRPGDEVIVPMKGEDMNDQPEGVKCYDWFFCRRRPCITMPCILWRQISAHSKGRTIWNGLHSDHVQRKDYCLFTGLENLPVPDLSSRGGIEGKLQL